ncbi:MAG: hypothetical protein R3D67_19165 [Hyphomicrobiaceae bacterium]
MRPTTHAYLGHSPGLDFETILYAKTNAPRLLEKELARPGYQPKTIALGAVTDPYRSRSSAGVASPARFSKCSMLPTILSALSPSLPASYATSISSRHWQAGGW